MEDKTTVTLSFEDWAKITAVITLLGIKLDNVKDAVDKLRETVERKQ